MKILHVLAQLPSKTGSGVYFTSLVEGLKKYGYEQRTLFAVQDNYNWEALPLDQRYCVNFKSEQLPFPIAGMSDVMPYDNTVYSAMDDEMMAKWKTAFTEILMNIRAEFNPDIILTHHLWILSSLVCEIFPNSKIFGFCHNTDLRQSKMNPHLKERHVLNLDKLDAIFAASEAQKNEIATVYDLDVGRIRVIGGGYNQNIFYPPKNKVFSDHVRLVFCAKIDPSKGIYELVEVFKSLNLNNVTLDIIGSPNDYNMRKLSNAIEGVDAIRLYNVNSQADLGDVMRDKDIFVMPSFYEGLGLMAIESLACGLYVVTTEIEALMGFLGQNINDSGAIQYVPLPRIYDTDKPVAEDLPEFKEDLKNALMIQIEKVQSKNTIPLETMDQIKEKSWDGLISKVNSIILHNIKCS